MLKRDQIKFQQNDSCQQMVPGMSNDAVIMMLDLCGCIVSCNEGAPNITGYASKEIIGQHFSLLYPQDERDNGKPEDELEVAKTKGHYENSGWRVRKDGTLFFARIVIMPVIALDGELSAFGNVIYDISENQLNEKQLREHAEILDLTHESITVRDMDGTIRFWNAGAEELFGFTKAEAIGQKWDSLLQTEYSQPVKDIQVEACSKGRWDGEMLYTPSIGEPVTVLSRLAVKFDTAGQPSSFTEIDININEKKSADRLVKERITELAASEDLLRSKMQQIDCAENAREIKIQERIMELAASSELLRSKMLELERSDEDRKLKVKERISELAASEVLLRAKMLEIERADEDRELKVQERIIELAASEKLLNSKVMELQRSNEELQQFAYICSHDLQEPLRVVSNYTQLLSTRYRGKLDDKADQFINFAVDAAKRMQLLINDLLTYSRLETRDAGLGKTDCSQVVKGALANLEMVLAETGATVRCDSLPTIQGDKSQLLQLFQNLIGNALKFRGQEPTVVDISVRQEGDHWVFAVRDNGIGFDMQFADRIFLIFQRLHAREDYAGSGIGLAVCKKIVLRHGGRMWVESEPNKGATFFFTVPVLFVENEHAR